MSDESSSAITPDVLTRARRIKLFLMDVDGTLTDGGVCLISPLAIEQHEAQLVTEMKVFNSQDGQGLSLAHTMGILTGFITGRRSPAVEQRAKIAYLGDDLPDIPLAQRSGLGVCVADGAPELKQVCHYTTKRGGGRGAAREVIELILKAQGRWEEAVPLALA